MPKRSLSITKDDLSPIVHHSTLLQDQRSTAVCQPLDRPPQRPYSETILSPSTLAIDGLDRPRQYSTSTLTRPRRQSSSEMRSASLTLEHVQPTQTPTGRVSKAKKGRRVHACEFPGCGKVFTRAEHRRRHELNHNPEARYRCPQPDCNRSFHRPDLLQRHRERHDLDASIQSPLRQITYPVPPSTMSYPMSSTTDSGLISFNPPPDTSEAPNEVVQLSNLLQPHRYSAECSSLDYDLSGVPYMPGYDILVDQSSHYTESDRSSSPVSNVLGSHLQRPSISSSYQSPLITASMPGQPWLPSVPTPSMFFEGGPTYIPDSIYQFPCPDWMEMSGLQYNKTCQPYLDSYLITPEPGYQIRYDRFV